MIRRRVLQAVLVLGCCLLHGAGRADEPAPQAAPPKKSLPRVLILGDSISLGYTPVVKRELEGTAEVLRPAENCQHTGYGRQKIKAWLGDGKWDVIHFNWGIWDTHMLDAKGGLVRDEKNAPGPLRIRHTPEQYRENLTALVDEMQKTGARLVWASTTPITSRTGDRFEDIPVRNKVAAEIMQERGIAVDDLYGAALPKAKEWQSGDKVHFNPAGNAELGKLVADSIRTALAKPAPAPKQ
jgi:acyl-CoA thioesterase-1